MTILVLREQETLPQTSSIKMEEEDLRGASCKSQSQAFVQIGKSGLSISVGRAQAVKCDGPRTCPCNLHFSFSVSMRIIFWKQTHVIHLVFCSYLLYYLCTPIEGFHILRFLKLRCDLEKQLDRWSFSPGKCLDIFYNQWPPRIQRIWCDYFSKYYFSSFCFYLGVVEESCRVERALSEDRRAELGG